MTIKELFKDFPNSSKKFYEWCKDNGELCELDLERLEIDLFCELSSQNTFQKYVYLNNGTLFEWLEEMGIYVTYKIKTLPTPKFIPVVYQKGKGFPIYTRKGCKSREEALYNAFRNGILEIEKNNERSR